MRIVQVFRAPVGGLYRHVRDLARGLADQGHEVGLICDASTGGAEAEASLAALAPTCRLGIHRVAMSRLPGAGDLATATRIVSALKRLQPDIVHGHGAKGGVYARLAAARLKARAVYTPHGGVLHYSWKSPQGALFLAAERMLLSRTHGLIFVCAFERASFIEKIGLGGQANVVVHNGLWPEEFEPVALAADATDLLFIGELRDLKGVDVLIEAVASLKRTRDVTCTITGAGPDGDKFKTLVRSLGLEQTIRFTGALPARAAFALGRIMVIPSRAESFPYMVLETLAAGKPLIASRVGGIPEVLGEDRLVPAGDAAALARRLGEELDSDNTVTPGGTAGPDSRLSASVMCEAVARFYASL